MTFIAVKESRKRYGLVIYSHLIFKTYTLALKMASLVKKNCKNRRRGKMPLISIIQMTLPDIKMRKMFK